MEKIQTKEKIGTEKVPTSFAKLVERSAKADGSKKKTQKRKADVNVDESDDASADEDSEKEEVTVNSSSVTLRSAARGRGSRGTRGGRGGRGRSAAAAAASAAGAGTESDDVDDTQNKSAHKRVKRSLTEKNAEEDGIGAPAAAAAAGGQQQFPFPYNVPRPELLSNRVEQTVAAVVDPIPTFVPPPLPLPHQIRQNMAENAKPSVFVMEKMDELKRSLRSVEGYLKMHENIREKCAKFPEMSNSEFIQKQTKEEAEQKTIAENLCKMIDEQQRLLDSITMNEMDRGHGAALPASSPNLNALLPPIQGVVICPACKWMIITDLNL